MTTQPSLTEPIADMRTQVAAVAAQGRRASMEDRHVVWCMSESVVGAVFDGHNGSGVAQHARDRYAEAYEEHTPGQLLRSIAESLDPNTHLYVPSGGACAVGFRLRDHRLDVANLGDVQLVRVEEGGASVVTEMHQLSNPTERARVLEAGATIGHDAAGRETYVIHPVLARGVMPTRALGDHEFAPVGVINEPFETTVHFGTGWLIAATDGVWDVVQPSELDGLLWNAASADIGAHRLALLAFDRGTVDNVTVVAVHRWVD